MSGIKTKIRVVLSSLFGKDISLLLEGDVKDADIISFDVFDTLILRPGFSLPSDLFKTLYPETGSFTNMRISAEHKAREYGKQRGTEDITIDEIYSFLPGYDKNMEIKAELSACKANPELLDFYNSIKKGQKMSREEAGG